MAKSQTSSQIIPHPTRTAATSGFDARLHGASIADLVQMECAARLQRVVRVTTQGNLGYLFFRDGRIVHASTLTKDGEGAAMEMLQWGTGTFEACDRAWPLRESIPHSWQSLLLRAAQAHDEENREADDDTSISWAEDLSLDVETTMNPPSRPFRERPEVQSREPSSGSAADSEDAMRSQTWSAAVRLGENGAVLSASGDVDELSGVAAYVGQLADLIGELLGLERFRALEGVCKGSKVYIHREDRGTLVGARANPDANLTTYRERIGL